MHRRLLVALTAVLTLGAATVGPAALAHQRPELDLRPMTIEVVDGPDHDQRVGIDAPSTCRRAPLQPRRHQWWCSPRLRPPIVLPDFCSLSAPSRQRP